MINLFKGFLEEAVGIALFLGTLGLLYHFGSPAWIIVITACGGALVLLLAWLIVRILRARKHREAGDAVKPGDSGGR